MLIFSQRYEEIRRVLLEEQDVGLTFLNGETGYKRSPIKVIVTVMPHSKIENVKKYIKLLLLHELLLYNHLNICYLVRNFEQK